MSHPAEVCPPHNAVLSIKLNCEDHDTSTTFLVKGPLGETVSNMPAQKDQKSYIIYSGAAVSVAPYIFMGSANICTADNSKYRLQSAAGQDPKAYWLRRIPIKIWGETIEIDFVICDVTQPLVGVIHLNHHGATILLSTKDPKLMFTNRSSEPIMDDLLFRMQLSYNTFQPSENMPESPVDTDSNYRYQKNNAFIKLGSFDI